MRYIAIFTIGMFVLSCNNGRPISAPRLRVVIDQDYIVRNGTISKMPRPERIDDHGKTIPYETQFLLKNPGRPGHNDLGESIVDFIVSIDHTAERTVEMLNNDGDRKEDIVLTILCGNHRYVAPMSYGLNYLVLNEGMILDLKTNPCNISINATGPWVLNEDFKIEPIRNPSVSELHFSSTKHVFLNGDCVK